MKRNYKYNLTFTYDNDILMSVDCDDYWYEDYGARLVVISNTTSFYETSRMTNLQITDYEVSTKW